MKKSTSPLKSLVTVVAAGVVGLGIGYAGVNAYLNRTSMQAAATSVSAIEPAAGTQTAPAVIHPTVNAADAGTTDSVQGTVDSATAPH